MVEIEQKISLSLQDLEKIFLYFKSKNKTSELRHKFTPREYYDTTDYDLYNNHVSLRIQYKKGWHGQLGGYEQTVKSEIKNNKNNLFRNEIKSKLKNNAPDLSIVQDQKTQEIYAQIKHKPLKHIFTAAAERRYFTYTIGSGREKGKVEIAFDVGTYFFPDLKKSIPMVEIEVEAKGGNPSAINRVCEKILTIAPSAKIIKKSKAQIGTKFYIENTRA